MSLKTHLYYSLPKDEIIGFHQTNFSKTYEAANKSVYASSQRPYFTVNGKEIVYLFDPPHLLKSTRNMFFKHHFSIDDELTDNKDIIQFYNEDSKLNLRLAPKLTHAHINPGPFEKMRVYLAAQIFSESVAAGMNTHVEISQ
ncbi:hypothetical protein QTP88_007073 [Uroleucon formosanum]